MRPAELLFVMTLAGCRSSAPEPTDGPAPIAARYPSDGAARIDENDPPPTTPPEPPVDGPRIQPPRTGWAMWPIPNFPSSGLPNPQSYDVSAAGLVLDRVTGLMWQRKVDPGNMTFDEANAKCSRLDLGGHRDWRLPSRIELVSILDLAETQPSIDREAFPSTPADWFWSSSVASDSPTAAWYVYFYFGYPKTDERSSPFRARCVRTEKSPGYAGDPDAHYEVGATTVRDQATGLTWQRAAAPRSLSFPDARAYCEHSSLDGHGGWRLPSMPELVSLVDERASNPAIDTQAFPASPADSFWTSSLFGNKPAEVWHVSFDHGAALYGLPKAAHRVRCVR